MPNGKALCWIAQLNRVLMAAAIFFVASQSTANAQIFRFDWSGTIWGEAIVIQAFLTATNIGGNQYRVDDASGTVVDNTPDAWNLTGNITGISSTNWGTYAVRNEFFFPSGGGGPNGYYELDKATLPRETGGFRIVTDAGYEYQTYSASNGSVDGMGIFSTGSTLPLSSNVVTPHTITQVPAPLVGAGMLSYLAVLLMGLVWRGRWLLGRVQTWYRASSERLEAV